MTAFKIIPLFILIISLYACATHPQIYFEKPNPETGRALFLDDKEYKEGQPWQFLTWKCRDYYGGRTLVEVGRLLIPEEFKDHIKQQQNETENEEFNIALKSLGFILYDGTDTGNSALYYRDGLSHRWSWGPEDRSYSFIIKPDGTGLFYDFSTAENGIKARADDVFKCRR